MFQHHTPLRRRLVPAGGTPEQLASAIRVDGEIFGRAIKAANIKVDAS